MEGCEWRGVSGGVEWWSGKGLDGWCRGVVGGWRGGGVER